MSFLIIFSSLLIITAIVLLWQCPATNYTSSFHINRDASASLKCVAAWMIIFHHLSLRSADNLLIEFFHREGIIFLNTFLILSGYGLAISFLKKGDSYLKGFFGKRLQRLLLPFLFAIVLFQILDLCCNPSPLSYTDKLRLCLVGRTDGLLPYSWYVFHQIICYIFFWIVFKIKTSNHIRVILSIIINLFYYILIKYILDFPSFWYINCFAFPAGLIYGIYADSLPRISYKNRWWQLSVVIFLCLLAIGFGFIIRDIQSLCFAFAVIVVFSLCDKHIFWLENYGNSYSYEVYLVQGLSLLLFRSSLILITNDVMYWIACSMADLCLAWMMVKAVDFCLKHKKR